MPTLRNHVALCAAASLVLLSAGCSVQHPDNVRQPASPPRWTQYGYDLDNSLVNPHETQLGAKNVNQLREQWRLRVVEGATSTPMVADGTAYFGSWGGHFYAVDAITGEIRWDRRLAPRFIRSTALVAGDRVYVGAGLKLHALDRLTGDTLFESSLDDQLFTLIDASPKLIDGMIILGLAHFDNVTPMDDYTGIGALIAFDADSGREVWRVATSGAGPGLCRGGAGSSIWSTPAIDPQLGLLYVGTGQSYEEPASNCNDSLLAIHYARDYAGERIAWKETWKQHDIYNANAPADGTDADVGASPNLFEVAGRPLVGVGNKGGSFRVLDRRTGELVWRKDLQIGVPPVSTGLGGVMTTAAVSGNTLYVASNVWIVGGLAKNSTSDPADTSVLYALDTATGEARWTVDLPAPMIGGFAIANGLLFHPIVDGTLYARELTTGKAVWSIDLGSNLGSAPSVVDGHLYISAGMVVNGGYEDPRGAFVASFGLEARPSTVRDTPPDVLEPLDGTQCRAALLGELVPTPECGDCLCTCDATAAGYCDVCFLMAVCTTASCTQAQPGDEMRQCLAAACGTKLLPTYLFDRAVDVAPCVVQCKDACGFEP